MISLNLLSVFLLFCSLFLLVTAAGKYGGPLIIAFFAWLGGEVLTDPNDKQGSTKRVCLLLVVVIALLLLIAVTIITRQLPVIPDSLLYFVLSLVATFTGGMVLDKGIAAYKTINGAANADTNQQG